MDIPVPVMNGVNEPPVKRPKNKHGLRTGCGFTVCFFSPAISGVFLESLSKFINPYESEGAQNGGGG